MHRIINLQEIVGKTYVVRTLSCPFPMTGTFDENPQGLFFRRIADDPYISRTPSLQSGFSL
jgi:hypothetical protein